MMLLLLSCNTGDLPPPPTTTETEHVDFIELDAPRLLRRMSLDLIGVLPPVADLDAVEADQTQLADLRDAMLLDERLEDRLVYLLAERWYTRIDEFLAIPTDYGMSVNDEFAFVQSVGEEPLRLMARIAVEDRPWTDIVTADHTLVNEILADIWPVELSDESAEPGRWQEARYTDGRPAVGVLATNGLWWRYTTTNSNHNRARAAAITDLLLCYSILDRPVQFSNASTSVTEEDAVAEAIREDPYCNSCHSVVEPLAASLFGFWWNPAASADEITIYHAEREPMGEQYLKVSPAYFGTPMTGLVELGPLIAADPRFIRCTAQSMAELLWRREIVLEDFEQIEDLRTAFDDADLRLKPLIRAVTDTDTYRAGGLSEPLDELQADQELTLRLLSPDQLASALEDISGFRWTWNGFDQMVNDTIGYRVMTGGINGWSVFVAQSDASLSRALTIRRLTQGAAQQAVADDLAGGVPSPRLFSHIDLDSRPGDAEFTAELEALRWRLYASQPDEGELEEDEALWSQIEADSGPEVAWEMLLWVLLNDPRFTTY